MIFIFFSKNILLFFFEKFFPKIDSGTVLSQNWVKKKTESELNQVHSAPTWPNLPRHAQARAWLRAQSALAPCRISCGRVAAGPSAVLQASMALSQRLPRARSPRLPMPRAPTLRTPAPSACSSSHNTIRLYCDTLSLKPALQSQSRYKICIVTHCLSQPAFLLYCNTNSPLSQPPNYIAIQFLPRPATSYCNTNLVLQYNFFPSHTALSCNTLPFLAIQFFFSIQLGSSPNPFCKLFFFIIIIIFSFVPTTGKIKKNIHLFFFHFP